MSINYSTEEGIVVSSSAEGGAFITESLGSGGLVSSATSDGYLVPQSHEDGILVSASAEGGAFTTESPGEVSSAFNAANLAKISETASLAAQTAAENAQAAVENIIPLGGAGDSMLMKNSTTDYDLKWSDTINTANIDGGYF